MLLGSSGYSAQLAGLLGLPYAFAHHFDVGTAISTLDAVALYRESFRPSPVLDEPYTIVTAGVLAAETVEHAEYLAAPGAPRHAGAAHRPADAAAVAGRGGRASRLGGGRGDAVEPHRRRPPTSSPSASPALAERTQADELMISTMTHGLAERLGTLEIVADVLAARDSSLDQWRWSGSSSSSDDRRRW